MVANDRQVGGQHYKGRDLEHWDWAEENGLGYLESAATKYISRWRSKDGLLGLEKSLHYTEKLLELSPMIHEICGPLRGRMEMTKCLPFCRAYELSAQETAITFWLCNWKTPGNLDLAINELRNMVNGRRSPPERLVPRMAPETRTDSNKHHCTEAPAPVRINPSMEYLSQSEWTMSAPSLSERYIPLGVHQSQGFILDRSKLTDEEKDMLLRLPATVTQFDMNLKPHWQKLMYEARMDVSGEMVLKEKFRQHWT